MSPINKRKFAFWGLATTVALSLCIVGFADNDPVLFKGETTTRTCGSIYYGNTKPSSAPTKTTNLSTFTTVNLPTTTAASSGYVAKDTSTVGEGIKLGSGSNSGSITFTFASSISIYDAYIYACAYKNAGSVTVTTGADDSTDAFSVSNSTAQTVCDPSTGGALSDYSSYNHVVFDVTTATTTLTINCANTNPIYLFKIVLSIGGSGSGSTSQSLASSLSAVSLLVGGSDSSISLTPSGFSSDPSYSCVASDASICSASVSGTTLTINGLKAGSTTLTITATNGSEAASTVVDVTVTAPAGAYLVLDNTTLSLTAQRASNTIQATSYNMTGTITYSATSSSSIASVTINSTSGLATVTPVAAGSATITIMANNGTDSITATCSVTVSSLPTPTITLSKSTLTIITSGTGSLTATATGFDDNSGVTYSASSSNSAAVSTSVTNNVITLTGVSAGSSTITVTGTYTDSYGTQTASATSVVTVSDYIGTTTQYNPYRVSAVKATGTTANVYSVDWSSSQNRYVATVKKTLTKGSTYIEQDDVAAYFDAFEAMPGNYSSSGSGTNGRKISTYYWNETVRTSGDYSVIFANRTKFATSETDSKYYELDVGTPTTNSSYSTSNRGAYRIIACPGASMHDYANSGWTSGWEPVCFYTPVHYADFYEYYNCYKDDSAYWSDKFAGVKNTSGSYTNTPSTSNTRPSVTTITY
jgi:hypothetical protein